MRLFYRTSPIVQTVSAQLSTDEVRIVSLSLPAPGFPLPWSHYVRLTTVKNGPARQFYETEALRAGWSFRQLDRQIALQFYERTALSRNRAAALIRAALATADDETTPEEEIKDPFVLGVSRPQG